MRRTASRLSNSLSNFFTIVRNEGEIETRDYLDTDIRYIVLLIW